MLETDDRYRQDSARHVIQNQSTVPFELTIELPPPLRSGVDYGFLPGTNFSKPGMKNVPQRQIFPSPDHGRLAE